MFTRCWITLGTTVRVAQSIGLHTKDASNGFSERPEATTNDEKQRIWYSIYILDRLLSLQLGRPPAIDARFFNITPPHLQIAKDLPNRIGQYFPAMIDFSQLIERVLEELYEPFALAHRQNALEKVLKFDSELLEWKSRLPRSLRFDLAHTFETCIISKRQVCFGSVDVVASHSYYIRETCLLLNSTIYAP